MRVDNVTRGEFEDLKRTIRQMQNATPLNNSGMGRGELFVDGGTITIANSGNLAVDGTVTVAGTQSVTGTLNVSGTQNVTGLLLVDGAIGIDGTLGINGNATVNGGGTITAGGMVIDPNVSGFGGIRSTGTIYLSAPGVVTTGQITAGSLIVIGSDVSITALPTTTNPPNLYVNGLGQIFRCI